MEEKSCRLIETEDAYGFRPDRGWLWLQRLCIWVLRRLGCKYPNKSFGVESGVINTKSILEIVDSSIEYMLRYRCGRACYVIVGNEQFHQLLDEIRKRFGVWGYSVISLPDLVHPQYRGAKIVHVSWFDGVVVLPDLSEFND